MIETAPQKTVAVIGASSDRSKFGNKSLRAHTAAGWRVFPVHPLKTEIEGLPVYRSIRDVPGPLDRVTLYIPPGAVIQILPDIAAQKPREVYFNPGTDRPDVLAQARALGLPVIQACSIVDLGFSAARF